MKYKYKITLFTPCYNGEKTIGRLFESVERQTCKDFEWIIINDGSTDRTDIIIKELIAKSSLSNIRYKNNLVNKGKHRVWNEAVDLAEGELFLPIDCDDTIRDYSISYFVEKWDAILDKSKFSGINVCCYNPENNEIVGDMYEKNGLVTDNLELTYKFHLKGEHWGCIKTELVCSIKFPEIKANYYSGMYLIGSIALTGQKLLCFNEPLRAYYIVNQSLSHSSFRDFRFSRVYMEFHYSTWKVVHLTKYLFVHSKKDLLGLYKSYVKSLFRICLFPFRKML